jgi:hypothetical protein
MRVRTKRRPGLRISDDLSLPIDAATQTFAFLARRGAGKTYACGKLAELLLGAGVQVIVLDSVGNWYGLRISADGKGPGFEVPVLGGLRGDIPLEETGGALVADTLVDTGSPCVLDISQFSKSARQRFATAFAERLWRRKKAEGNPTPIHLVIEESQLIVPQNVAKDETSMLGIYEEIIRLGRNYGIGVSLISQRPQSVNKEVLNQTECLFVLQTNGKQERDALRKWIVAQGGDTNLEKELPSLPIGTAYVWSPQWLGIFQRVRIGTKVTFDASATPRVGQKRSARKLAPLDLGALKEAMVTTIERAKASDPKALIGKLAVAERRIAELTRELERKASAPPAEPKVLEVKVPVLTDEDRRLLPLLVERLDAALRDFVSPPQRVALTKPGYLPSRRTTTVLERSPLPAPVPARVKALPRRGNGVSTEKLAGGERKILTALAQYPQGRTKVQVALLTRYAHTGGGFQNYLSSLRGRGLLEGSGDALRATDAGLDALGDYTPLPVGDELLQHWLQQIGKAERLALQALAAAYPASLSKEQVAATAGYEVAGGGFQNALSRLRTLELIGGGRDGLRASDDLFG